MITYELPIVSARAVPQQINFFNAHSKEWVKVDLKYCFFIKVGELDQAQWRK